LCCRVRGVFGIQPCCRSRFRRLHAPHKRRHSGDHNPGHFSKGTSIMNPAPDTTPPSGSPAPAIQTPTPTSAHPAPRRSRFVAFFTGLGRMLAALTTLVHLVVLLFVLALLAFLFTNLGKTEGGLKEHFYAGNPSSLNKIAVIRIDGVLFEGLTGYALSQIDAAAKVDQVKAIVLRITSPGGTSTASDDLDNRPNDLRSGTH